MKFALPLSVVALFAFLGLALLKADREQQSRFAQQAFLRARVRAEVNLAIERQDYVDAARSQFPALADQTSELYHACIARYGDLVEQDSPMLNRPDWPLLVAQEEAARLGITPTVTLK